MEAVQIPNDSITEHLTKKVVEKGIDFLYNQACYNKTNVLFLLIGLAIGFILTIVKTVTFKFIQARRERTAINIKMKRNAYYEVEQSRNNNQLDETKNRPNEIQSEQNNQVHQEYEQEADLLSFENLSKKVKKEKVQLSTIHENQMSQSNGRNVFFGKDSAYNSMFESTPTNIKY